MGRQKLANRILAPINPLTDVINRTEARRSDALMSEELIEMFKLD
jgi:hypothetical protein